MRSYSYQNPDDKVEVVLVKGYDCLFRAAKRAKHIFADALCRLGEAGERMKEREKSSRTGSNYYTETDYFTE